MHSALRHRLPGTQPSAISHQPAGQTPKPRGGGRGKKMTKVTCICCSCSEKKSTYLLYFVLFFLFIVFLARFFGRFVTRRVQKHGGKIKKKHLGSLQQIWLLFRPFFFFFSSLGCLVRFFYRVFGRFVTREVQKRD
jgi:hypothetical protein